MRSLACMTFITIPLVCLLSACASAPNEEQLASANYGRQMAQSECISIAEQVIANQLKDPNSAQFRHGQCEKGHWSSVPLLGMDVAFGWVQTGQVNGKNAFGGYVGFRPYEVLIRNGVVVRYCIHDSDGLCIPSER